MKRCCAMLATLTLVWVALAAWADGPKDNLPDAVRAIPSGASTSPPRPARSLNNASPPWRRRSTG